MKTIGWIGFYKSQPIAGPNRSLAVLVVSIQKMQTSMLQRVL